MRVLLLGVISLLCASAANAQPMETVAYPTLGIEMPRPDGWHSLSAEANSENLRRVFENGNELQRAIARNATVPIAAFTKYSEPYPDLNPSIKINVRPLGELTGKPPRELVSLILPGLSRVFPDMQVEQAPTDVTVGGQPAAYARIVYTFKIEEEEFPTTSELWIVPRKHFLFLIGAGTRQDEANGTRAEIHSIISSIAIGPET